MIDAINLTRSLLKIVRQNGLAFDGCGKKFLKCSSGIVASIFLFAAGSGHAEVGLRVSGVLSFQMFSAEKVLVRGMYSTNTFIASLSSSGHWALEVHPISTATDAHIPITEAIYLSFDGKDTFFCLYSEAKTGISTNGRPGIIGKIPINARRQQAYVSSGNYPFAPFETQGRANILWLVFGSGFYLHGGNVRTMPLPWIPARQSLLAYGFRLDQDLSVDPPYVPRKLKFIRDPGLDRGSFSDEMDRVDLNKPFDDAWVQILKQDLRQRSSMFETGSMAGQLEAGDFTNKNGLTVPRSFKLEVFIPDLASEDHVRRRYTGTVTNIDDLPAEETFRPPLIANLYVHDSRFRTRDKEHQLDEIIYSIHTNEAWLPTNDVTLQRMFAEQLQMKFATPFHPGYVTRIRLIGTIIFLGLALPLPVFLYWRSMRKRG